MFLEPVLIILFALLLDNLFSETRRYHPLVGFGRVAKWTESRLNKKGRIALKAKGLLALFILLLPLMGLVILIQTWSMPQLLELVILYFVIGRKSLQQHALAIVKPLEDNDVILARQKIALIVSRDTENMNEQQVIDASIESVVENSNDAIFASIFWFLVAGAAGALMYRLANTLDAMWGYKNSRYFYFGWAAARFDDVLNWLPARLVVLSFALLSLSKKVWTLAFQQGLKCSSKNAGPVMAAGACALNVKLGGPAIYETIAIDKPELGCGDQARVVDIRRALVLIDKTLVLWLLVILLISVLFEFY